MHTTCYLINICLINDSLKMILTFLLVTAKFTSLFPRKAFPDYSQRMLEHLRARVSRHDLFMVPFTWLVSWPDHEFFHGCFIAFPSTASPSKHTPVPSCDSARVITMAFSSFTTSGAELAALNNKNNNAYHLRKLHKISKHF